MPALIPQSSEARLLTVVTAVSMTGYGIYLTSGVLYVTRVIHLPVAEVGAGLTIAAAISLAAGIPFGHLADRRGARPIYTLTLGLGAIAMAGLCLARNFWTFLSFATLCAIAQSAGPAARSPLIQKYGHYRPAEFRGYLRSVTNLGIAIGALLAGWAITLDTSSAYVLLITAGALSYALSAMMVLFLPRVTPTPPPATDPRRTALRDHPYVALTLLDGLMAIQYRVLTTAVPLWLVERTTAPKWSVSLAVVINTVVVVLFQVRASRGITTPTAAGRSFRRAGLAFLLASIAFSIMASAPAWLVLPLLIAAVLIHTIGEIWHAAGGFELSFALAPPHALGQYQGLFGMGLSLGITLSPALLIVLCIEWGPAGWWTIGTLLAFTGATVPAVTRWAERHRPIRLDQNRTAADH